MIKKFVPIKVLRGSSPPTLPAEMIHIEPISSIHYPPEYFMTEEQRRKHFENIMKELTEHPEKFPFLGDKRFILKGRNHANRKL